MSEEENEMKMATPVTVSKAPIDLKDITLDNKESVINAYLVSHNHPTVLMIEGLILVIDKENFARPYPHVWNRIGDIHFDPSAENNWPNNPLINEAVDVRYFSVKSHTKFDFIENNEFAYCEATLENLEALNNALLNNYSKLN